jgi:two-component system sensor histidine kinase MtrB
VKSRGVFSLTLGLFRRSLQARAVFLTVVVSGVALVALGGFLSYSIGNGLYQTRLQQVLAASKQATVDTQNTFSAASVTDDVSLQTLLNSIVPKLESNSTSQTRQVALLRAAGQSSALSLQSPISADFDPNIIPSTLRQKVASNSGQLVYQSVPLLVGSATHPALIVGSQIQVPIAGDYELYLIYDIQSDQETLDFVQRTLFVGGSILILIIGLVSYFVTDFLVKPVLVAAKVSEDLASGDWSRRITERGEDATAVLARSFNSMADSLQDQIARYESVSSMQQRFVSDVSHELRTPLTAMMMSGDQIFRSRDQLPPRLQRSAEILHNQVLRFNTLLQDLLEISRYDAGAVSANFEVFDLAEAVGTAMQTVESLAQQYSVKMRPSMPEGPFEAEFDFNRIERLIVNLLSNAIEHGEGRPVDVAVGQNASSVAVTVTDYGIGMTKDETARVFDRFWRADTSRKRTLGGNGLGLAIALEDATLHGGWLQVWSEKGKGASFRLTLPKQQGKPLSTSPLPLPPAKPLGSIKPSKPKVEAQNDEATA